MSRRADPARIDEARRAATVRRLEMSGMSTDRAESFRRRFVATGRKLDMGKSCVRFRRLDDLPLDLIAETVAATPVDDYIDLAESARGSARRATA